MPENDQAVSNVAISIVIPIHNAEKYIGKCLDSLRSQTFQDFEIITIDDYSTDGSVNIVESYIGKFDGRLRLIRTEKFSDSDGSLPRNIGLNLAGGEYVYFIGANDFLAENALETLFNAAKEYDADVVYTAACYNLRNPNNFSLLKDGKSKDLNKKHLEEKPVLIIDNPEENVLRFFAKEDFCESWTKFLRRDFLSANKILFPEIPVDGEYIWSINVYCHAKRFLRLPVPLYFYRSYLTESVPFKKRTSKEQVLYWVSAFATWLKTINKLIYKNAILQKNLSLCYSTSLEHFRYCFSQIFDVLIKRFNSAETYSILFNKFAKEKNFTSLMVPLFFSAITNREKFIFQTQKNVDELTNTLNRQKKEIVNLSKQFRPAISVIIPLYNAEKYLGECLNSILAQTFQNFEVILVDDCSTDSSCKIVESYMPKFGGRLKLYHMPENTGSGALPRNKGLSLSLGEYVFNMDNDDMITETALEELYTLAKKFDADVVYCEKYYGADADGSNIRVEVIQKGKLVEEPTFEPEDLNERVQRIIDERYWVVPWAKLVRRSVVVDNNIIFPGLAISDDNIWNQGLLFYAKKFLRVPNVIYIYRTNKNSILRKYKQPQKRINFWINPVLLGLKSLDELMSRHDFFKKNPDCRYALLKKFISQRFDWILSSSRELPENVVYEAIKSEFGKYFGDADVLVPCLCAYICEQNKSLKDAQASLARAQANEQKAQDRITELKGVIGRLKQAKGNLTTSPPSVQFTCPSISVVIPMYNAQKFIGECLQSLLIQTFQDFEVIVVDDCSTDNSVAVVESYAPKFNGRLKLLSTKVNSGGGGYVPRNLGMSLASGEYVFFSDADDFLLGSALETLYTAAKEYNTDVVYSSAHYALKAATDVRVSMDGRGKKLAESGIKDKLTLSVNEPEKILYMLIFERGFSTPWTHFIRRDFLLKNKIVFPEIPKAGDYIWVIHAYCCAKRLLRLPTPLYFYNVYNPNSVAHAKQANKFLNWVLAFVAWSKALAELTDKVEILKNNPAYCYEASKRYFEWCLNRTNDARKQLSDQDIYEILYREFSKENDFSVAAVPFFFSFLDAERKANNDNLKTIDKLKKEVPKVNKTKK